jgi:hypothetical protein
MKIDKKQINKGVIIVIAFLIAGVISTFAYKLQSSQKVK